MKIRQLFRKVTKSENRKDLNYMKKTKIILSTALLITLIIFLIQSRKNYPSSPSSEPTLSPYGDFNVHIPQKALLKNYINVAVEAEPGTECTLTYVPPMGESMQMETIAKSNGLCEWRWQIKESDTQGHARLIFTINGLSDTHFLQIFNEF